MAEPKTPPSSVIEITPEQQQQMAMAALQGPTLKLYANGFIIAQTASDVVAVLLCNGVTVGVINLSHVSAKTLSEELTKAVTDFEKASGQKIRTVAEITKEMTKFKGPGNVPAP